MTLSAEIRGPVDQWVKDQPGNECRGAERRALLAHLKIHFPNKTPQELNTTLHRQIRKIRGIIAPERTRKAYKPRAVGAPTSKSKEVKDVRNAIHNPRYNADRKRKRTEEAIAMLEEKGYKDRILPGLAVEKLVDEILTEPRAEFDDQSIIDLIDRERRLGLLYVRGVY
jgi:hypothetical protein